MARPVLLGSLTLALGALLAAAPDARAQFAVPRKVVASGGARVAGGAFVLQGTAGQAAAARSTGGTYALGSGFWTGTGGGASLTTLALGVWLQGPFNGTSMNVALSSVLPTTDPYGQGQAVPAGFFSTPAGQQVVDWVLVEVRAGDPAAPPMAVEQRRAALLLAGGRVVDVDGTSDVAFAGLAGTSYYVAVRHRNHLAAMSAGPVDVSSGAGAWDFRAGAGQAYGPSAQAALGGGAFGLYGGDGNGSGAVSAADLNGVWRGQNGTAGYVGGDLNLSGGVSAADRNAVWRVNNGRASQVPPAN